MIRIITDSTVCVKKADAIALGVRLIPVNYCVRGNSYYESYSDCNGNFEELLKSSGSFTTSAPNTSAFLSAFEEELSAGNEILCITLSSRLSGAYSAAFMAAKQTGSPNVFIFDSQLTGGGLYLLVSEAKKLIDTGLTLSEIMQKLPAVRERITVAFSVNDMTPLRRSGRIGFVRMSVGTILNTRPILLCREGTVVADSIARGDSEVIRNLTQKIPPAVTEVVINYIANSQAASNLYNVISAKFPKIKVHLLKLGPVLGIHLGLQTVAVSFI